MTTPFVFFTVPEFRNCTYWYKRKHLNRYYWEHLGRINQHMADENLPFAWKLQQMETLARFVGEPVKLNWWQKILSIF